MGNTHSVPEPHSNDHILEQTEERKIDETTPLSSTLNITSSDDPNHSKTPSFQLSITKPSESDPTNDSALLNESNTSKESIPATKPVPVANAPKSGWVSSTGGASPWYSSLSSSTSSHHPHRASISGPYYRARGMSVSRDADVDEDLVTGTQHLTMTHSITSNDTNNNSTNTSSSTSPVQTNTTSSLQPPNNTFTSVPSGQTDNVAPTVEITFPTSNTSSGIPTIITWTQGGNQVYVTGTFNGWKHKIKLVKSIHDFSAVLELPPGTHRLKFIVDDEWKCSTNLETATDPDGNLVNYLQVLDEEEEEELNEALSTPSSTAEDDEYGTVIPAELLKWASQENPHQKKPIMEEPPTLPPHLQSIPLNSETVSEEDNSVLLEPNHVTLNHMYACSIKDDVMALATTSRYRKKFVTTMYYRPVFPKE